MDITKSDVRFKAKTQICGSFGNGIAKSIDILVNTVTKAVYYQVINQGVWLYKGPELDEALEIYNNIQK